LTLGGADLIGFVGTADVARARTFYEGTLGLSVTEEDPYAIAVDANGTMLRVTAVPAFRPAGYTVCGWRVDDIAAVIKDLTQRGVSFLRYDGMDQDDLGVWIAPTQAKVAWFNDPDGNVLSLTELAG
jgi:catechol 2,3-dioxygenase-like lactoylglutathione lyase family enzyme